MDRLIKKIIDKRNPSALGLDPLIDYVPSFLIKKAEAEYGPGPEADTEALWQFNKAIIDETADIVPALKLQSACYEIYGSLGARLLEKTMQYAAQKELYVILDGKRNDIGSTAAAYAKAYLDGGNVGYYSDCITINAYLGTDGVKPFKDSCVKNDKTAFILVKTSNPSSGELQDQYLSGGKRVYEKMAELIDEWNADMIGEYGYGRLGAVVGATYPAELTYIREQHPRIFFLIPGFGFQGGGADDIKNGFDSKGLGAIVNNSRGIMLAYRKSDKDETFFAGASREEAVRMRDAIRAVIRL